MHYELQFYRSLLEINRVQSISTQKRNEAHRRGETRSPGHKSLTCIRAGTGGLQLL